MEAQVIALGERQASRPQLPADERHGLPGTGRAIRSIDVLLLLPLVAPLVAAILLGLLSWFVAWLAIVGTLVMAIVCGDLARAMLWRRSTNPVQALDRQAVG